MEVFRTAHEMRNWSMARKSVSDWVGFVPTMGALHEGHLSLMRSAAAETAAPVEHATFPVG